jgi:hypothetical protein
MLQIYRLPISHAAFTAETPSPPRSRRVCIQALRKLSVFCDSAVNATLPSTQTRNRGNALAGYALCQLEPGNPQLANPPTRQPANPQLANPATFN